MASLPKKPLVARIKGFVRTKSVVHAIEAAYPFIVAIAAGFAVWKWSHLSPDHVLKLIEHVLPIAVTVAAVLAGFQATAQSVLISLLDSNAWRYLQRNNHDARIVDFHWAAIWSLLIFVLVSLGIIVVQAVGFDLASRTRLIPVVLVIMFTLAVLCAHRVAYVMVKILRKKDGRPTHVQEHTEANLGAPRPFSPIEPPSDSPS